MRERPFSTLARRYLWESRWYNVRQDQIQAQNGQEFTYTVIESPGAVWIVPVTPEGKLVLINQYRYTVDTWCLEVPAGNIEPDVTPEVMAARELREETGGSSERIVHVNDFFTMNGIGTEIAHIYVALDVSLGPTAHEPTEHIELVQVPIEEGLAMARAGQIKDGPSALAILLSESILRDYLAEREAACGELSGSS